MSRNTKIALVVGGALAVMCLGICAIAYFAVPRFIERAFSRNAVQAKEIGAQIVDYTLPPGYEEKLGMDLLTTKMVVIGPAQGGGMMFVLMGTSAPGMNRQEMEQQLRQSFQQQFQRNLGNMRPIGQQRVMVRGEPVTLNLSESDSNPQMRQAIGGFAGDHGYVMVMVTGMRRDWDDALLRGFLGSIR